MRATIEQWRVFLALVEHGSYAAAADAVSKSVSSVHTAIQKLQSQLGVELFEVRGRKVELTHDGRQLLRRAGTLIEQARALESLAAALARGQESRLRVAVDTIFPFDTLNLALAEVAELFPEVRIDIHESVIRGATELYDAGEVDIAITPLVPDVGVYERVGQVRFSPVVNPAHALNRLDRPVTLGDLRQARHILVRDSSRNADPDEVFLKSDTVWTTPSMDHSISMIVAGLGFAWLPLPRIAGHLERGELVRLPMAQDVDWHVELFLVYRDSDVTGPVCARLLEGLRTHCGNAALLSMSVDAATATAFQRPGPDDYFGVSEEHI